MGSLILNQDKPKEWLLPKVNNKIFSQVLDDFANYFEIGKDKQVLLVLDGARWHTSKSLKISR